MKKDFSNIGDRNSNMKKGKDLLFTPPEEVKESTLSSNRSIIEPNEKIKIYPLQLPEEWHTKLKFDISKDTGKSLKDLILDAIAEKYGF